MELQKDIAFKQLVQVVKALPMGKLKKLKAEIERNTLAKKSKTNLKVLLLNGPVATNKQLETMALNRNAINLWRTD